MQGLADDDGGPPAAAALAAPLSRDRPAAAAVALPAAPVDTAQQFFAWFASVEASMERGRADVYRCAPHAPPPFFYFCPRLF
jgi:hypothetical protein